jgi:asparagine N-glycosylation enzyme membrane subunit Stt3
MEFSSSHLEDGAIDTAKKVVMKNPIIAVASIIVVFGIYLRVQNLKFLQGKYLYGTDSYRYFRQTRLIVEEGELPQIDHERNFPEGLDLTHRSIFLARILALFYSFIHAVLPSVSLHCFASLYPPIATGIALIFFFLLTRRLLGDFTALLALLMLAGLPVFIQRTRAGYVDTDALIILFLFTGTHFYLLSFTADSSIGQLAFAGIAGGVFGLLGLTWPGSGMIFLIFCIFQLMLSWESHYTKRELYRFSCWLFPMMALILTFGKMYWQQPQAPFAILALYIPVVAWCILLAIVTMQRSPRVIGIFCRRFRLSVGLGASLIFIFAGGLGFTIYSRDLSWVGGLIQHLRYPFGSSGVMKFVGELKATSVGNWWSVYGMTGFIALAGFCLLAYRFRSRNLRHPVVHSLMGVLGLLAIAAQGSILESDVLGRFSSRSSLILLDNICLLASLVSATRVRSLVSPVGSADHTDELNLLLLVWNYIFRGGCDGSMMCML